MRRVLYVLAGIAVLAFGLSRCWPGSKQDAKHPHEMPSAAAQGVDPTLEASEVSPTRALTSGEPSIDAGAAVAAEEPLLRRLHVLEQTNPRLAASLALEDRQHFPNSPDAEERDVILVAALHNQRDVGGARREAWYYFMHHPGGKFTDYLSKLTGMNPPTTRPGR